MFRKGFTLVEILIAMALVGVLVAIVTPNLTKVMPDKKKALFIKAYARTEVAVANMVNDPEMYPAKFDITASENGYEKFGLTNDEQPEGLYCNGQDGGWNCYSGDNKFMEYFAQEVGGGIDTSLGDDCKDVCVSTNDNLVYDIYRVERNKTKKDAVAAHITVKVKSGNEVSKIGVIQVFNDGGVECLVKTTTDENDKCQLFLNDRYNLKQKR